MLSIFADAIGWDRTRSQKFSRQLP